MKFKEVIDIVKERIDLSNAEINYFRECIKGLKLDEEQKKILVKEIPQPWYLKECPNNKQAIYNEIAEIIDGYMLGDIVNNKKISKIQRNIDIFKRLINMREKELAKSKDEIEKDPQKELYSFTMDLSNERIKNFIDMVNKKI